MDPLKKTDTGTRHWYLRPQYVPVKDSDDFNLYYKWSSLTSPTRERANERITIYEQISISYVSYKWSIFSDNSNPLKNIQFVC